MVILSGSRVFVQVEGMFVASVGVRFQVWSAEGRISWTRGKKFEFFSKKLEQNVQNLENPNLRCVVGCVTKSVPLGFVSVAILWINHEKWIDCTNDGKLNALSKKCTGSIGPFPRMVGNCHVDFNRNEMVRNCHVDLISKSNMLGEWAGSERASRACPQTQSILVLLEVRG